MKSRANKQNTEKFDGVSPQQRDPLGTQRTEHPSGVRERAQTLGSKRRVAYRDARTAIFKALD